jgi:hypothetical protein
VLKTEGLGPARVGCVNGVKKMCKVGCMETVTHCINADVVRFTLQSNVGRTNGAAAQLITYPACLQDKSNAQKRNLLRFLPIWGTLAFRLIGAQAVVQSDTVIEATPCRVSISCTSASRNPKRNTPVAQV